MKPVELNIVHLYKYVILDKVFSGYQPRYVYVVYRRFGVTLGAIVNGCF
jgi:hypothetical protein